MRLARAWAVALSGVDGIVVEVEADVGRGLPGMKLLGLPDAALHEAKDRVQAAVRNSKASWPDKRVTLGLSPASLPKAGAGYDIAIACAVLAAAGALPQARLESTALLGELALDGRIRPVCGVLPGVLAAKRAGLRHAIVPAGSVPEAGLVDEIEVLGADRLADVIAWLHGEPGAVLAPEARPRPDPPPPPDLADVIGQPEARWALEVVVAGGHHLLLTGPPGTGKTMLAQRLAGLLPTSRTPRRWRSPRSTPSSARCPRRIRSSLSRRSSPRTTPCRSPRWSAVAPVSPNPAPSAAPTAACCSSTRPSSSASRPSSPCGPPSNRRSGAPGVRGMRRSRTGRPGRDRRRSGVELGRVRAILPELELTGLIQRRDDGAAHSATTVSVLTAAGSDDLHEKSRYPGRNG